MLTFLKTFFQKKPAAAPAVAVAPSVNLEPPKPAADQGAAGPQVAVARLSLLAILQKLPADLQPNISHFPDASVTVALPVATIQKQLAAGSVKMSLASLYRQAPAGTFSSARVEEKRMIEVPLAEVMKHVQPHVFRRRADQRRVDLPRNAPQLFGDRANPYAIAPLEEEPEPALPVSNGNGHGEAHAEDEVPLIEGMTAPPYTLPIRMTPVPLSMPKAVTIITAAPFSAAPAAPAVEGEITFPLARLCEAWPEPARAEAAAQPEALLVIPAALLAPGMAKGKVAFSWGQVRGWITPPLSGETQAREATEILLPLKVVAPAFLAHSRVKATPRKEIDLDETIPAMFDGGEAARPVTPAAPERIKAPEPAPSLPPADAPSFRLATGGSVVDEPVLTIQMPAAVAVVETSETPVHVEASVTAEAPFRPEGRSPQAMMESTAALPGVAGAIVALREGLVVAAKLPEHMKGDTVAAFLPQMFARLNTYTQEMQLGEVEDLLLTVNGAHFQSYHMGEIYFAVLGKAGEALPWTELRLVAQELQAQTVA